MLLVALLGAESPRQDESAGTDYDPSPPQSIHAPMTAVTVEIDIFSGVPNPQWTLSEADSALLLSRLAGLQKTTATPRSAPLGYRGLIVTMPQQGGQSLYVQNGVIEWNDGTTRTFLLDSQRSLERWLAATGRKLLSRDVLEALDAALQQ